MPGLKVRSFCWSDAKQDTRDFQGAHALRECRVKTAAALLDKSEMEPCGTGNGLGMVRDASRLGIVSNQVRIASGNGGVLTLGKCGNGIRESITEIGIFCGAPIAGPPTGVHGELSEVGESSDVWDPGDLTGAQVRKLAE